MDDPDQYEEGSQLPDDEGDKEESEGTGTDGRISVDDDGYERTDELASAVREAGVCATQARTPRSEIEQACDFCRKANRDPKANKNTSRNTRRTYRAPCVETLAIGRTIPSARRCETTSVATATREGIAP